MAPKKSLSLKDKEAIIRAKDVGESNYKIAERFDRNPSVTRAVYKRKDSILHAIETGKNLKLKRLKKPRYLDIDISLVGWLKHARSQNIPISGDMLKVTFIQGNFSDSNFSNSV